MSKTNLNINNQSKVKVKNEKQLPTAMVVPVLSMSTIFNTYVQFIFFLLKFSIAKKDYWILNNSFGNAWTVLCTLNTTGYMYVCNNNNTLTL